ncbi:MAG TPA: beta-galactosidase trimerization domain-containing protein [Candidatus Pelethocola excrementipullorum]|nr:beta-galactosidase trimerization domain-containing protein [Candidatus Pelethocola excrementipullorum]
MQLSSRQVHLDFHTSEKIPDIAKEFQAGEFAVVAKAAHVNSMTVFARCHHGWVYYDSKKYPELLHPHLTNRNLMMDQVRALHKVGIKAPVYITVQWDYYSATNHPEWLIRKPGGAHEGGAFTEPGFYQSLCVNTGYQEYLKAITTEVIEEVGDDLDGLFFDIVGIRPCWCASCRKEMKERGIDMADEFQVRKFAHFTMSRFKREMTDLIREYNQDCTIFYNAGHVGPALKDSKDSFSHFELESLPSGDWGYQHFPVTARYARKLGKDCMGMTGKFHTAWGDFHSLKNQAALEFECFRMLSYGFACSIGDQLEPWGKLNPATYHLIGNVYGQIEEREPWSRPSVPVVEAAVVTSESMYYEHTMPGDVMGAAQMLEELGLQFDIIDPEMSLDQYRLVILPDSLYVEEDFQKRLEYYVEAGGSVIACGNGGLNDQNKYPDSFGVAFDGIQEEYPDFLIAEGELAKDLYPENEYVIYRQGNCLKTQGAEVLMSAHPPYFKRERDNFCSHLYVPSGKKHEYPVAFQNGNVIVFSHPLFGQYRENAPRWCKTLIKNAIEMLMPNQLVRHNGSSTISVQLLEQPEKKRYILHVLTYIPVRKSATIDTIEERTLVRDLQIVVNTHRAVTGVKVVPEEKPLELKDHTFTIPECDGYAMIELSYA